MDVSAALDQTITLLGRTVDLLDRALNQNDAEHAELRDGLVDLDHRIADVAREGRATREVLTAMQEDLPVARHAFRPGKLDDRCLSCGLPAAVFIHSAMQEDAA